MEVEPTIEIEERTWNLVSAVAKLWVDHEGDMLTVDSLDLRRVHSRKLKVTHDEGWYLLDLTHEPAPPHIEYPDRVPPDRKGSQ